MMIIVAMNCKSIDEDARVSINVYSDGYGDGDSQECAKRQNVFFFWSVFTPQTSIPCLNPQNPSHPPFG